ncbi:Putative tartrate transporter [Pseudomonas mediterranea]|nr:Putative tartrate transporter [Pseudomonas mediterranea]
MDGVLALRGWHWLFLLGGIPCVLLGLVVLRTLKDRVQDAAWLTTEEKALLARHISSHEANKHGSLLAAIKLPGFLMLGLIYFLIQVASYGLNFWAPQLIRSAGTQSPVIIGLLTAVPYICGAISMLVIGRLSDISGERRKFACGLVVLGALGFFSAGIFAQHTIFLIGALALLGAGIIASIPAFWALPPKLLAGAGAGAAGGIALINTMGQFGGIVSPVMVGHIKDLTGSTTPALYVIGFTSLLAAALLYWALPERLRTKDQTRQ